MNPSDRKRALDILKQSETRLTARSYIEKIGVELGVSRHSAKKILKTLVCTQELVYQDLYGSTYVDISFAKPVRITDHFYFDPFHSISRAVPGQIGITLLPGISFGSGHHATTRLCLQAIDYLFFGNLKPDTASACADIGTGSGVLAIALCLSGMAFCRAWDIDPNAASEALKNVAANGLSHRVDVMEGPMPVFLSEFSLICANLRFPTLITLSPRICSSLKPSGVLILSGFREWERDELISHYAGIGFTASWQGKEKGWSVVVLKAEA